MNYGDFAGLHQIAAFLGRNGFEARVFGGDIYEGWERIQYFCDNQNDGIVGLYCDFENVLDIMKICKMIKSRYGVSVIVGGPQATALGEQFLKESGCAAIVRGEGELTMLELAQCFLDNAGILEEVKGIAFIKKNGKYCCNSSQTLIKNLDKLPFIDAKYSLNSDFRREHSAIMTGRGCPFRCSFCHEGHHNKVVRLRSVPNVLQEIKEILEKHPQQKYILFTDDTFTLDPMRVKALCAGMKELQKEKPFVWFCEGHVKTLHKHPEMIDDMVAAGVHRIQLGIEAGTSKVLDAYRKGATPEEIKELVAICRDKGVRQIYGNIILGGAFFSKNVWEQDRNFIKELLELGQGVVEIGIVFFWPLPETSMTQNPKEYGIRIQDYDFLTSFGDFPQTDTEQLTVWEINEMGRVFHEEILQQMDSMLNEGGIPHERILAWYENEHEYHCGTGAWYQIIENKEIMGSYYKFLMRGASRLQDISQSLGNWCPQRTFSLRHHLKTDIDGKSYIGETMISDLERALLQYSTGKLTLDEILKKVYLLFEGDYENYEKYRQHALASFKNMDNKFLMVYFPF